MAVRFNRCSVLIAFAVTSVMLLSILVVSTKKALIEMPDNPQQALVAEKNKQVLARDGTVLSRSYQTRWNVHQPVKLHQVPELLKIAFVLSEDQHFYRHAGVDWYARLAAVTANVRNGRVVRGASTITEQVVRMIHPRPRNIWSRWLEGFEAAALEKKWGKQNILEFYLNQVPYASNRRGIVQASLRYFDRSLETLNAKEILALAVMVRAPSRFDVSRNPSIIEGSIHRLATRLQNKLLANSRLAEQLAIADLDTPLVTNTNRLEIYVPEFVQHVRQLDSNDALELNSATRAPKIRTTLDPSIQRKAQSLMDRRLYDLARKNVRNGAVLVVDRNNGEILAWVNGGHENLDNSARKIDAVLVRRQVGSVLKPFVYALALQRGWTAATLIDDAPLAARVNHGQHDYRNYSGTHYGLVSLRDALGNSLNIPAVRAVEYVGVEYYLDFLRSLGCSGLEFDGGYYGGGIALGNVELSLFDVVKAYTSLARSGRGIELTALLNAEIEQQQNLEPGVAVLVSDILRDSAARKLEFGDESILNFAVPTSVKTGTSSAYRDSWAVAYDNRYIVGAWMGNLDGEATVDITGSTGPALVVRSLFDQLRQRPRPRRSLAFERAFNVLESHQVCTETGQIKRPNEACETYSEYFVKGHALPSSLSHPSVGSNIAVAAEPKHSAGNSKQGKSADLDFRISQPTKGLHMALDPRIPLDLQAYEFILSGVNEEDKVVWVVNSQTFESRAFESKGDSFVWPLTRGEWQVQANVFRHKKLLAKTAAVDFIVK